MHSYTCMYIRILAFEIGEKSELDLSLRASSSTHFQTSLR